METTKKRLPQLAELELEALEEYRDLVRAHLEKKCQAIAEEQGRISPLNPTYIGSLPFEQPEAQDGCGRDSPENGIRPGSGQ